MPEKEKRGKTPSFSFASLSFSSSPSPSFFRFFFQLPRASSVHPHLPPVPSSVIPGPCPAPRPLRSLCRSSEIPRIPRRRDRRPADPGPPPAPRRPDAPGSQGSSAPCSFPLRVPADAPLASANAHGPSDCATPRSLRAPLVLPLSRPDPIRPPCRMPADDAGGSSLGGSASRTTPTPQSPQPACATAKDAPSKRKPSRKTTHGPQRKPPHPPPCPSGRARARSHSMGGEGDGGEGGVSFALNLSFPPERHDGCAPRGRQHEVRRTHQSVRAIGNGKPA